MDGALVLSGLLMGAAGAPHCAAMCGAASSAMLGRCGGGQGASGAAFHVGRVASYAAVGALAASSVALLRLLGESAPALRPIWTLLHVAALALGLWLLVTGRQPAWMSNRTRALSPELAREGWQRVAGPVRAGALGLAWVAWPCGLLQSAVVVATLASNALSGALVMAAFAVASSSGLWAANALWRRSAGGQALGVLTSTWVLRFSGACLAVASGWALGSGLWHRVAAFCLPG
ncbi:sulfite exporter TauE/SafE family protein [Sphaerotilaceae bacterium SBD11-9]